MLTLRHLTPCNPYYINTDPTQLLFPVPWYSHQGLKPGMDNDQSQLPPTFHDRNSKIWRDGRVKPRERHHTSMQVGSAPPLFDHYINGPSFNGLTNLLFIFYHFVLTQTLAPSLKVAQLSPLPPLVIPGDQMHTITQKLLRPTSCPPSHILLR